MSIDSALEWVSQPLIHTQCNQIISICITWMHLSLLPIRHVTIPGTWGYLLNTRKWLLVALHGPSVWQSLPGRFPPDDTRFGLIANFLTLEPLTFFNKSSPGCFWSYLRPLRAATTDTSSRWVTCLIYMYMNEMVGRKLNRRIILQYQVTVPTSTHKMLHQITIIPQNMWLCTRATLAASLKTESCHDANFSVTAGTDSCHVQWKYFPWYSFPLR